jgi:small subunit ribosomal protein S5
MDNNNSMEKFEEKVIQVSRVSKKTKGGNKVRFAALVVVGDRRGKVGIGLGKSGDVAQAIAKAVSYAKRRMIFVPIHNETITQQIRVKKGAAQVLLKPAPKGTGIIAGGAIRSVVEVAGAGACGWPGSCSGPRQRACRAYRRHAQPRAAARKAAKRRRGPALSPISSINYVFFT